MTAARLPKVLAVDDRPDNLLALQAILQGLPIEVIGVDSGEEALKRLLVDDYAVILLDALMPGMDGFETAGHIKRRQRTQHIPIVFLTAMDTDSHPAFRGYQAGAVDYLTKPFDPWVLRAKVSVFVDLWTLHVNLAERAEECGELRTAIDETARLLDAGGNGAGPDLPDLVDTLARARERLRAVRERTPR
ncbi:MAG: response regulator [Pseudonocardiales bacterium]|nr:response regulator [Pseudonocardiales bacterium]